jgi:hypothetical protein
MTQEQLYTKLLQNELPSSKGISKEFLRDFQFCKIALEKIGIDDFSEGQQMEMNLEAVAVYFSTSMDVWIKYNITKINKLIPRRFSGSMSLWGSGIRELSHLESVGGCLDLQNSQVKELLNLESVGGHLSLENSQIRELPKLESVGKILSLYNSQIKELPSLRSVGYGFLTSGRDSQCWKDYFIQSDRPRLAEKVFFNHDWAST